MSEQMMKHFKEISRREFLVVSLGAGVVALMPRIGYSQSAEPYRIGVLLPTTERAPTTPSAPSKACLSLRPKLTSEAASWASTR